MYFRRLRAVIFSPWASSASTAARNWASVIPVRGIENLQEVISYHIISYRTGSLRFKIKLFDVIEDRYIVKSKEKLIKSVFQKRSEIIETLAKSINNYNQLEKVVLSRKVKMLLKQEVPDKKTDSSSPDETTFDIKAGIDKLYNEFKIESKILDLLLDLIVNTFQPEIIQSFYTSKIKQTKYIEEYIS